MKSKSIIDILHYLLGMFFNLAIVVAVGIAVYFITIRGFEWGENLAEDFVWVGEDESVTIILDNDMSASEFAHYLEYRGIISNRLLFNLEVFLMGGIRTYEAGTYTLNRNMSNGDIRRAMSGVIVGQAPHEDIRIPEGWTLKDMADYFEYRGFFTAEEFIYVATEGMSHFNFPFISHIPDRPNGLEGYLFPDSYQIPTNPTPGCIIIRMLTRFDQVFDSDMREAAYQMGLTVDEVVIMASIIERETRLASERSVVSQVIHNRLAIDMLLQMCSTVAYVLDVPRDRLLNADLEIDSPYNTYMFPGLPIGPISNPGAAALRAVVNPSGDDYLFFVLYNFETGEHFFSRTWGEHDAADARARARQ